MLSARTVGSALALAAFLGGKETPLRAQPPDEELPKACFGCMPLYPGVCLPVATCLPEVRLTGLRGAPMEDAEIEALPVN